jgi:hypothetical protein
VPDQSQQRPQTERRFNPYRIFEVICVPLGLLPDRSLSAGAKLLYGRLLRYAGKNGKCYPSVATLACDLGVTERQVRFYLIELEQHFLIRRHSVPGHVNQIEFVDTAPWPSPLKNTSPLKKTSGVGVKRTSGGGEKNFRGSEVLKRSKPEKKNARRKKRDARDYDCPAIRRKQRAGQPDVAVACLPESVSRKHPRLREALARYLSASATPDRKDYPTDRRVVEILDAAGGAAEDEVVTCLAFLYNERGLRPGTKHGPRNSRWFLTVVREHFESKRRQEEAAHPSTYTEWADRNDKRQQRMDAALELPDAEVQ